MPPATDGDWRDFPVEQTTPLRITRVELGSTTFATDRGQVELPAWLFHPVDALGPIAWPAVGPETFWRPGAVPPTTFGDATLDPDGRTVTVVCPPRRHPARAGRSRDRSRSRRRRG